MPALFVTIAVEGDVDAVVVRRLVNEAGFHLGPVHKTNGKTRLDNNLRGYNNAAARAHWLVLRDLDRDVPCAPNLIRQMLPAPAAFMCFRIAVRTVEAWLLADRLGMAELLKLPSGSIPRDPEALVDAKATIVQLARGSNSRRIREEIVPAAGTSSKVGPGYTGRLMEFAADKWQPRTAALSSPSLARCLRAIETWR